VIGDNTVRGVFLRNSEAIRILGEASGLHLEWTSERELPPSKRYLPPPKGELKDALSLRMRSEVVLEFCKRGTRGFHS
jgi:hypothetical protein